MDDPQDLPATHPPVRRDGSMSFMSEFEIDDTDTFMTSNAGGPIGEQESLSAGEHGPTLLEDFAFREKIMHFG
jgi:catalase